VHKYKSMTDVSSSGQCFITESINSNDSENVDSITGNCVIESHLDEKTALLITDPTAIGWLGFNGTFSTNRPYRAIEKVKVC